MFGNLTRMEGSVGEITRLEFKEAKRRLNSQLGREIQPESDNNLVENDLMLHK
jgi:hypothetical protein